MAQMKEGTLNIFKFLREHDGEDLTATDVAEALGVDPRSVNGSFTSFQKKGWGKREEAEVELSDGKHQRVKFLRLTDEGRDISIDSLEG